MTSVPEVLQIQAYSERLENEEREIIIKYVSARQDRIDKKKIWRDANINKRGTKFDSKNLKAKLKKNNVLIKKLRQFSQGQLESILRDIDNLNLSKYLSEIVEALIHCKLKFSDIHAAVKISSKLHLIYADFSSEFLDLWKKHLNFNDDSPVFNRHKFKIDIVFFCELIISGIFHMKESLETLHSTLCALVKDDLRTHKNIYIILNFCKYCSEDFLGSIPKRMRILSNKFEMEIPQGQFISSDNQQKFKGLIKEYHDSLCSSLTYYHETITTLEKRYNDHLFEKGDVHPDKLKQLENHKKEFSSLQSLTCEISEIVDLIKPSTKKNHKSQSMFSDIQGMTPEQVIMEVWGDKDTEQFYTVLPNVEEYLFLSNKNSDTGFEYLVCQESIDEILEEDSNPPEDLIEIEEANQEEETINKSVSDTTDQLQLFLNILSNSLNQVMIDNGAFEFLITYNSKQSRQKLVDYIFTLPRTRYDLFPFVCRFLAIINQVHPEVVKQIADKYYKQFRYLIVKKDQIKLEIKIKNMKVIAELLKFKLFSNIYGLYCLKLLLNDFAHHHIEMACVFLENCGKFLYFSEETHCRTKSYLEQMLARKNNVILDLKYKNMIESTYHLIIPAKVSNLTPFVRKPRPVMHEFIRHLLYTKLDVDTIEFVRELLEKLNWEDVKTERYIIRCLSDASNMKLNKIHSMAILVETLVEDYEEQMIQVIDNVLEDIRFGLEMMAKAMYQRRIAMVTYLGHLYVHCQLVGKETIFTTLYTIISHLVHLESANDLSRVALTLTLLDTCYPHFPNEVYEEELRYFIVYFQHYFLHKRNSWENKTSRFPMLLLQHRFEETFQKLYPKTKPLKSIDESSSAVQEIFCNISQKYNLNTININMDLLPANVQTNSICDGDRNHVNQDKKEDKELDQEHDKLVINSMKERVDTSVTSHIRDLPIPVMKRAHTDMETPCFMLLRKHNRKPILKELSIPPDSEIMTTFISSQKSLEDEMLRVKQITLQHNNRLQQEST